MGRALVFDSGVGGLSVVRALVRAGLPLSVDYVADAAWLPYGEKSEGALQERAPGLIAAMAEAFGSDLVVLACNTASTLALEAVRARLTCPVVGTAPPIKPAATATRSGVIGLLATPATVQSAYVDDLIDRFAGGVCVLRHGDSDLVQAAEDKLCGLAVAPERIARPLASLLAKPRGDLIDVVALACTHFPLLREDLVAAAPVGMQFIDSADAIARRVAEIAQLALGSGCVRLRRAAATGAAGVARLAPVFMKEGFEAIMEVCEDSPFDLASWPPRAMA